MLAQHSVRLNSQVSGIWLLVDALERVGRGIRLANRAERFAKEENRFPKQNDRFPKHQNFFNFHPNRFFAQNN
jgi:hypothetical protein